MPYVKIEDGIFRNPKMVSVGSGAKLIYVASICYCGSSLTDGFVPTNAVRMLGADTAIGTPAKSVKELVGAGLWREVEGGYQVHDYLQYNESSDKVQAKKDAARDRMNKRRSVNSDVGSHDVRANNPRSSREVREPTTTTTTTDSQQVGNEHSPKSPTLSKIQEQRFQRWYATYPRKVGRLDAVRAWSRISPAPTDELTERMIAKVQEWTGSEEWSEPRYIPHPTTWLNDGRWDDGAPAAKPSNLTRIQAPAPNGRSTNGYVNEFDEYMAEHFGDNHPDDDDVIDVKARVTG